MKIISFQRLYFSFFWFLFDQWHSRYLLHHRLSGDRRSRGPKNAESIWPAIMLLIEKVCLHSKDCHHCKLLSIHKIILPWFSKNHVLIILKRFLSDVKFSGMTFSSSSTTQAFGHASALTENPCPNLGPFLPSKPLKFWWEASSIADEVRTKNEPSSLCA